MCTRDTTWSTEILPAIYGYIHVHIHESEEL